ncbi:MAG: hypothetical protein JRH15_16085 [Deltaproteobacteria bacterium]|nr:hypothetical protein [Deltaproteobacteria bacterium]
MEVLVAMMILSTAITLMLQLFSGGLKVSKTSADYTRAVFHAREVMEALLIPDTMRIGEYSGDFRDGFNWKAGIERIDSEEELTFISSVDLIKINVDIMWRGRLKEKHFDVSTIAIAGQLVEGEKSN